jgi:uncharacterized protein
MDAIGEFRNSGINHLLIGAIKTYQLTISKLVPARCRLTPSCSQYGIEAIKLHGFDGIDLTYRRIRSCKRPNSGYDPVPLTLMKVETKPEVCREQLTASSMEPIAQQTPGMEIVYNHKYRMILTYPKEREFYDKEEFKQKIAGFHEYVLNAAQFTLLFKVDNVEAGIADGVYLLKFSGTMDGEYLQHTPDEVVGLVITQLEYFFTVVQPGEFKSIYFEVDGQIIYQPDSEIIPEQERNRAWDYTSQPDFWDVYWDSYMISQIVETVVDIATVVVDTMADSNPNMFDFADPVSHQTLDVDLTPTGDLDVSGSWDLNPFDGDGCEMPEFDGCDLPDLDLSGCVDGCGDGCDLGGCDFSV